jgi:carboxymethylenebutenolidase
LAGYERAIKEDPMCYPPGATPPAVPEDLLPAISGGAGGADVQLTSADGTRFRAYLAPAAGSDGVARDAGVLIVPDVRGLHQFYELLAERFATAGVHALAFDFFGRTAGTARRPDDFDFMPHVRQTTPQGVFADIAASRSHLEHETGARRTFVLGFCFGGRIAFLSSAEQPGLAGVVGFYGRLSKREGETWPVPAEEARRMRAPVLGLFGGDDPGIPAGDIAAFDAALAGANVLRHIETYAGAPHSFFDRTFAEHKTTCDDAWRRVLTFVRTGDPAKA